MSAGEHDATEVRPAGDLTEALPRAAAADDLALTPGAILGDRYRIVAQLGRGGMGLVYRADDLRLGQPVALKFVGTAAVSSATLREEVRIGRQISHPNICRVFDLGDVSGRSFIAMEYVDGEDLSSLLRRIGRLAGDRALSVARDICAGLGAIHAAGVVHRDLKPANVMIDSRGRARITDFGLALVAEHSGSAPSAGTPAYMAPEQLAGQPATVRSDVFALGLVLYEVFTGRRTYPAGNSRELAELQKRQSYARPSTLVGDLHPAVDRAIAQCLDPDPAQRPASAEAVLRELPGYDPVAAAIAAGETPSAGAVAEVATAGELSISQAAAVAAVILAGLFTLPFFARRTMLYGVVPEVRSPEVLEDRARAVIAAAGVTAPRADSSSFVFSNVDQLRYAEAQRDRSVWHSSPSPLMFRYRQSPRSMSGRNFEFRVLRNDPPFVIPGMADVDLDSTGRLIEFATVPPLRASGEPAAADFTRLIQLAGFEPSSLIRTKPEWTSPVDSDSKVAWLAASARQGLRIEAASFHGRPVWFAVIPPWRPSGETTKVPTAAWIAAAVNIAFLIGIPIAVILIARRNLARGLGDRRGAFTAATLTLILIAAMQLLRAHHPREFTEEWLLVSWMTATSVFWATMVWLTYIAVEPLVRRRWPQMLVSWLRLLRGRWRDPMCGRDTAIGIAAGVIALTVWHVAMYVPLRLGLPVQPAHDTGTSLGGTSQAVFWFVRALFESGIKIIGFVVLLLVVRLVARNTAASVIASTTLLAVSLLGDVDAPLTWRAIYAIAASALSVWVLMRNGVIGMTAFGATVLLLRAIPLTLDPSDWYFLRSAAALVSVGTVAIVALLISIGGRRGLSRLAIDI